MLKNKEMQRITYAVGDGIGPEIMAATKQILEAAGARLIWDEIKIGQSVYESGNTSGIGKRHGKRSFKTKCFSKHLSPRHRAKAIKV